MFSGSFQNPFAFLPTFFLKDAVSSVSVCFLSRTGKHLLILQEASEAFFFWFIYRHERFSAGCCGGLVADIEKPRAPDSCAVSRASRA